MSIMAKRRIRHGSIIFEVNLNKEGIIFLPDPVIIAVRIPTVMVTLLWVFRFWQWRCDLKNRRKYQKQHSRT